MFPIRLDPMQSQRVQKRAQTLHDTENTDAELEPDGEHEHEHDPTLTDSSAFDYEDWKERQAFIPSIPSTFASVMSHMTSES